MAKLRNLQWFTTATDGQLKTIGHNRQVETDKRGTRCALHGRFIVVLDRQYDELILNHQGYRTATTRNAMNDFIKALGFTGAVSFAGGKFAAKINDKDQVTDNQTLTFKV